MFTRRTSNRGGPPRLGRADRPVENVGQRGGVAHGRQLHAPGSVVVRLGSWNGTKDRRDINTCMVNAATHMVFITGCRSSRGRYIEEMPEKADSQALLLVVWGILEFPIAHPPHARFASANKVPTRSKVCIA